MIEPETQVSDDGADDGAGDDVDASMLEIRVARRADVESEADWNQGEKDSIGWRSGGLIAVLDSVVESCGDGTVI